MCSPNQHHAALGDGAAGQGLSLCADLINNQDLGHVVLDSLNLQDGAGRQEQVGCFVSQHTTRAASSRLDASKSLCLHNDPGTTQSLQLVFLDTLVLRGGGGREAAAASAHHDVVLPRGVCHLHPARSADGGVRHVPVTPDLVGRVDNHDALVQLVRQRAGNFTDGGRLADAGTTQEQDRQVGCAGRGAREWGAAQPARVKQRTSAHVKMRQQPLLHANT